MAWRNLKYMTVWNNYMNICIFKKIQSGDNCLCVDNIVPLLAEAFFPWSSAVPEKGAASSEEKCSYSIASYNTKRLEQTSIIIDYKERVSKASFVIG